MKKNFHHNLIVLGAGLTGMVLALRLAEENIKVCLVERRKSNTKNLDRRTTAVSKGSSIILKKIGAWSEIEKNAQKIERILVSEGVSDQNLEFDPKSEDYDSMGYIIDNGIFKRALEKLIKINSNILVESNCDVENLDLPSRINRNRVVLQSKEKTLSCDLLLAADGRFSKTRFHAEVKYFYHDYKQSAYVFNIRHEKSHQSTALERFFPTGPLAILPMKSYKNKQSSVVWTVDNIHGDLLNLSPNLIPIHFPNLIPNPFLIPIYFLIDLLIYFPTQFLCYHLFHKQCLN